MPFAANDELALHVPDPAAAEAFYVGVLGCAVVDRTPDCVALASGALRLYLLRDPAPGHEAVVPSFDVPDRAAALARLRAAGCTLVPVGPHAPGAHYVRDPHGILFDVVQRSTVTRMPTQEQTVPTDLTPDDRATLERVVTRLEAAWNAMDGPAFAAPFAADADFVNVRGDHARGRDAIAAGHAEIFRTVYAGSTNRYAVETARLLRPDVALVHVRAVLSVPGGPLAGRHDARYSAVLTREAGGWVVASFHNTHVNAHAAAPGPGPSR